jgi:transposase
LDSGHVADEVDSGQGKVVKLDTARRRSGQDDSAIAEQIRNLLDKEPGLSGRAVASRLGCSPTTAAKWKSFFEDGGQTSTECVNE